VLVASCITVTLAWAEAPGDKAASMHQQGRMKPGSQEPLHPGMRARMQAHDARLDELVAVMNAAEGEAKLDAVAAVVNELVAQRRTRRDHLEERWKMQQTKPGERGRE
jgi:hypothetical protein